LRYCFASGAKLSSPDRPIGRDYFFATMTGVSLVDARLKP
jgi:hypothetical protein